jgi:hypothetical protein
MRRPLPFAAVLAALLALPTAAAANPSIEVSSARDGSTARLPAKATHTLKLTAGATQEELEVSISPPTRISVTGASEIQPPPGAGPSVAFCPGRGSRMHEPFATSTLPGFVFITIAAGQTATLTADVELTQAPWPDETLDAMWSIDPAQGRQFDVISNAPLYSGPLGVKLAFRATRAPDGHYVIAGTTDPPFLNSGRVDILSFPPDRDRSRRIARVPVRNGKWSFSRFLPDRRGRWELYARYRSAGRTYANDVTDCSTFVTVR